MFSHIKTSKENKEVVTQLTNKLNLGAENVIARIALAHSLAQEEKLDLTNLKDSGGKEYSSKVLFGDYTDYYAGMVALHYNLHISDKDLAKYIKIHIDEGLQLLHEEMNQKSNIDGYDFLIDKVKTGMVGLF